MTDASDPQPAAPEPTSEVPRLPARSPEMHKGDAGRVVIVAGSMGMSGAAVLCGVGALRSGAGLVRILAPADVQPIIAGSEPCLMVVPLPQTKSGALGAKAADVAQDSLAWADAAAFGPGLGDEPYKFLWELHDVGPAVFDADAFRFIEALGGGTFGGARDWWDERKDATTVLTPHPGEMIRLRRGAGMPEIEGDDDAARISRALEYAEYSHATVVLKGHRTVVATPDQVYVNTTGNAGMATGGMGDVLTGMIAALLAQGMSGFDAARAAVYAHGLAADSLAERYAPVGYLAREVADALPPVLAKLRAAPEVC